MNALILVGHCGECFKILCNLMIHHILTYQHLQSSIVTYKRCFVSLVYIIMIDISLAQSQLFIYNYLIKRFFHLKNRSLYHHKKLLICSTKNILLDFKIWSINRLKTSKLE